MGLHDSVARHGSEMVSVNTDGQVVNKLTKWVYKLVQMKMDFVGLSIHAHLKNKHNFLIFLSHMHNNQNVKLVLI